MDRDIDLDVYRCKYADCLPPLDPNAQPPPENRPQDAMYWSQSSAWQGTEAGWGGNNGDGTFGPPVDNTDVKIKSGKILL